MCEHKKRLWDKIILAAERSGANTRKAIRLALVSMTVHFMQVTYQRLEMTKLLLESNDKAIMNLGDKNSLTPLHYAAERGFTVVMQLLVDRGVDKDIADNNGFSPYLWAVVAGQEAAAANLLTLGVNINFTSADGKTALGWAVSLNHSTMAQLLVE